jgi:hypothetical protein
MTFEETAKVTGVIVVVGSAWTYLRTRARPTAYGKPEPSRQFAREGRPCGWIRGWGVYVVVKSVAPPASPRTEETLTPMPHTRIPELVTDQRDRPRLNVTLSEEERATLNKIAKDHGAKISHVLGAAIVTLAMQTRAAIRSAIARASSDTCSQCGGTWPKPAGHPLLACPHCSSTDWSTLPARHPRRP